MRAVQCDGGPPTIGAKSQSGFEVAVTYSTTGDADLAAFEAGQPGSQRRFASMNSDSFFFYEDPVVGSVALSTNAELVPGRPLFSANQGRRALQNQLPAYGGDRVLIPATAAGDAHIPALLTISATELNNGNGNADKDSYQCMFNRTSAGLTFLSAATYFSDTELECPTPDLAGNPADQYELLLSKNGQHFSATGKIVQTFNATQIAPTFAAVQGVADVEIEVTNGFAAALPTVYCRFGDWLWPDTALDRSAPQAGLAQQATNALQVPLGGSVGDVVAATFVSGRGAEVWSCPIPEIQDSKAIKPRNVETPVRISYDGKSWTNAVSLFYFDQPDVRQPVPPIGPTGGGTLIQLRLSGNNVAGPLDRGQSITTAPGTPREYYRRSSSYSARCLFSELSRVVTYAYIDESGANVQREANNNASVVVDWNANGQPITLSCTTPPNPQPGSKFDLDVSLDGGLTWAYDSDSSSGRALPSPPDFSYYAETAVITQDAASNYDSGNDFRGRINVNDGRVDVRFQYSCGYTTAFANLVRCKFGNSPPSGATLAAANIGATVVNVLTCNVPLSDNTGTVDLSISLNGIDFTVRSPPPFQEQICPTLALCFRPLELTLRFRLCISGSARR